MNQAMIYAALDRLVENGYVDDFDGSGETIYAVDPRRVAVDLNRCDADFDDLDETQMDALTAWVHGWQLRRRPR